MKPSNGVPDAAEFGKIRSYLAIKGVSQADIDTHLGASPAGRTRAEITESLKTMCQGFPKAV
ncbi:MAG: hypothetical protein JRC86_09665 [Deltaproteobacteria bacterium]|nr:hypothetical protein [Deltaproteobacteria bacterium]